MKGITHVSAWRYGLLVPALWLAGASIMASAMQAPPGDKESDQELGEVLVTGKRTEAKRIRDPQGLVAWLNRLRGEFTYEGHVELGSEEAPGDRQTVKGASKCGAYGPAVNCAVQVAWPDMHGSNGENLPGGVSALAPAMVIYAIDLNYLGIRSLQVDSRGMADSGLGYLAGDTLTTTTTCVDIPGDCKRISRIEARPDGKLIQMQTDIEQDEKRVVSYSFVLRRLESGKQ